jgi:hypothetical protein
LSPPLEKRQTGNWGRLAYRCRHFDILTNPKSALAYFCESAALRGGTLLDQPASSGGSCVFLQIISTYTPATGGQAPECAAFHRAAHGGGQAALEPQLAPARSVLERPLLPGRHPYPGRRPARVPASFRRPDRGLPARRYTRDGADRQTPRRKSANTGRRRPCTGGPCGRPGATTGIAPTTPRRKNTKSWERSQEVIGNKGSRQNNVRNRRALLRTKSGKRVLQSLRFLQIPGCASGRQESAGRGEEQSYGRAKAPTSALFSTEQTGNVIENKEPVWKACNRS